MPSADRSYRAIFMRISSLCVFRDDSPVYLPWISPSQACSRRAHRANRLLHANVLAVHVVLVLLVYLSCSYASCPHPVAILLLLLSPSCCCPPSADVLTLLMLSSTLSSWTLLCCRAGVTHRACSPSVLVVLVCSSCLSSGLPLLEMRNRRSGVKSCSGCWDWLETA